MPTRGFDRFITIYQEGVSRPASNSENMEIIPTRMGATSTPVYHCMQRTILLRSIQTPCGGRNPSSNKRERRTRIMNRQLVTIGSALAIGLLLLPARPQSSSSEARAFLKDKDRWAVKTGADPAAKYLRTSVTQPTRVKKVIPIERPIELPLKAPPGKGAQTTRYSDTESKVFTIDADIIRYRLDPDDRDFHIVIRDHDDAKAEDAPADSGERRTMIAKIPDPAVVVRSSPWRSAIVRVRRDFEQRFHPGTVFTERIIHAKVTGVGFFDYIHGQNGVALNGLELHPVLDIEILDELRPGTPAPPLAETPPRKPANASRKPPAGAAKPPVAPSATAPAGQVWVNLSTGTYWRPGARFYGKTKRGRYMSEEEAIKIGFIPGVSPQ